MHAKPFASAARQRAIAGFFAATALVAAPVAAADFYASPGGDDSHDCSSAATACKTIQAAIDKAAANDTVHVGQGDYPFGSNRIVIAKAGLKLVGDNSPFDASSVPGAPVKAANAAVLKAATATVPSGTSGMVWIKNVANVEVRNLYIELTNASNRAKEGIVATGAVQGMVVDNNFIKIVGGTSSIGISVNLAAGGDSSVPSGEPRASGQFVTLSNNAVVPTVGGSIFTSYAPKRAIAMYSNTGTISDNQVAATTQDMWIQSPVGSGAALTVSGNWFYGALQFYLSSGSNLAYTLIDGNHFTAPPSNAWGNGSEAHSLRVMGNNSGPTTISNNEFLGFGGVYRALWVMSRADVTIEGNTFTPLAGQSDFTAIVVGNREVWNGLPAPNPYDVTIRANTFNANGATSGNKAKAILFVDDNDDNGVASFSSAIVGGPQLADANQFDAGIGWYIALDDRTCTGQNHNGSGGGCNGTSTYAIGSGIAYSGGSNQSSQKRPFRWDVNAVGNTFGGIYMPAMTQAQYDAVWAKTYDKHNASDSSVGNVLYGYPPITTGTIVFSPTSFTYDGNAHTITATLQEDGSAVCVVTPSSVTDAGDTPVSATCTSSTYNVTGSGSVHVDKATGSVTWGALSFTYDGSSPTVTAILTQDSSACTVTGSVGPNAGSYPVHADCSGTNYTASADDTAQIAKATGSVTWGTLSFTYDGSSPTVTATLSQDSSACTVTGTVGPDAGSYPVHADCSGTNYTASADDTVQIAKATGSVTWSALSFTYDGSSPTVTATLTQDSSACTVTGTVGPDAGSYPVHAECSGTNYTASADDTAQVAKATSQTALSSACMLTFVESQPFTFSANVSGAGTIAGSVTFDDGGGNTLCDQVALNNGVATCTNSTLTANGAAPMNYALTAAYGGDANHQASASSTPIDVVVLSAQDVVFRDGFESTTLDCPIQ